MSTYHRTSRRCCGFAVAATSVALVWLLPGCVANIVGPAPNLYNLTPKSSYSTDLPEVSQQLVVEEPVAAGGLDSHRIALRPTPTEVKYFADSRWTERAPRMVQTLLVESFENTGKIVSVGRQAIGLRSDFNLKTELREFQAEYFGGTQVPTVRVRINAKIIQQPRQMIMTSRSFEQATVAKGANMAAIIAAFDDALGKVLKSLVEWTLHSIEEAQASPASYRPRSVPLTNRPTSSSKYLSQFPLHPAPYGKA